MRSISTQALKRLHSDPAGPTTAGQAGYPSVRGGDNEIRVQEGPQPGQQRLRGLLRPIEERVLLLQELARGYHGGSRAC